MRRPPLMPPPLLRVLHTEASLGFGGQERRVLRELERLDRTRFDPRLLVQPGSQLGDAAASRGVAVLRLRIGSAWDPVAFARALGLLRRERIDIVHAHSPRDSWVFGAAGKWLGIPVFRTRHLMTPIGGRFVYTRLADRVVTVSEGVRRYLIEAGVPGEKIVAVPTGIDLARFDPGRGDLRDLRAALSLPPGAFVIGMVSVLRKAKGHHAVLRALKRLAPEFPGVRLLIAGTGPQEANLRALIRELDLERNVLMLGHQDDIPSLLRALDAFVQPSSHEALGTALIEAAAMGVPIVATQVGGIPEVVGDAGILLPSQDDEALAEALRRLIASPELARGMGERGMKRARELYDEKLMVRRTEALYLQAAQPA